MILKGSISKDKINYLKKYYTNLQKDEYTDLERFRALSRFCVKNHRITKLPNTWLKQPHSSNSLFGELPRRFSDLDSHLVSSFCFKSIFSEILNDFKLNNLEDYEFWVHQIRTKIENSSENSLITPEGIHRDDAEKVGIICVDRSSIGGARNRFYKEKKKDTLFHECFLKDGEYLVFDDNKMWHDVSQATALNKNAYRDTLIFCGIKKSQAVQLIA